MIAVEGIYDNGAVLLEKAAPINKAKVLVIFPDTEEQSEKEDFRTALLNDTFVIPTDIDADEYVRELRKG